MKITFLGGAGTVTGSKYLVTTGASRLLVDCGLYQGLKSLRRRNWSPPPVDPASLDAVLLTHAHIDHSGYLPALVREGFTGPIYATTPSLDLVRILLEDSARLQEEEARHANKHAYSRHHPAAPLYTVADAERVFPQLTATEFGKSFAVGNISITPSPAGHILGAASLRLATPETSVIFSGDLGPSNDPIIRPPEPPPAADCVVMESTYGDRDHPPIDPIEQLAAVVDRTIRRGGKVLASAFAVGRAQRILWSLGQVFARGLAPEVPVFLDSPMASDVTDLYQKFGEFHRLSAAETATMCQGTTFLRTRDDSKSLNGRREPCVIVSASGMLSGGRITHHLKHLVRYPEHTILLPGFQAPGTRGAALLAGAKSIKIQGARFSVKAETAQLNTYSAHTDQSGLLDWVGSIPEPPRGVFLVHGEPQASETLRREIIDRHEFPTEVAEYGRTVDLTAETLEHAIGFPS